MKRDAWPTELPEAHEMSEHNLGGALRAEFPHLNIIHEIEIRGACHWQTLAEASLCLMRCGAEPISVSAQKYHDEAQRITCRIRSLEEEALKEAIVALKAVPGVTGILLSHHLGRASDRARAGLG